MKFVSLYKAFFMYSEKEFNELYKNRINSEASIIFDLDINGNNAFFFYHAEINNLLSKIYEEQFQVEKIFFSLPELSKFQYLKKSLVDEIVFSNEIEGVISTRKDINDILENVKFKNKSSIDRLKGIVNKYFTLIQSNNVNIKTVADIRKLYDETFLKEVLSNDKNNKPDGKIFRKEMVFIKSSTDKEIHRGIYPEDKLISFIEKSLAILEDDSIEIFIRIAIFHYLFGYAHPFYDGNGRLNRLISSCILEKNRKSLISFKLSLIIKENLSTYYDAFKHTNDVRNKGDITTFVYEFLNLILNAYEKIKIDALEKKEELNQIFSLVNTLDVSKKEKEILLYLSNISVFSNNGIYIKTLCEDLNISLNTAKGCLLRLIDLGFVETITYNKRIYYSLRLK